MIIRAKTVVTMDGPPIENGAVVVAGGKIAEVGTWNEIRRQNSGAVTDLGEQILLPGLINAHCHLEYTLLRGSIPRPASFTAWIREINARKAALKADDYQRSIKAGFSEAAGFGTTTLANLEAFPELLRGMETPPMRAWWFAEMIDISRKVSASELYEEIDGAVRDAGWHGGAGLAPHAPFSASESLYAEAIAVAERFDIPLTTHLAESEEEMQMYRDRSGPLFEFLRGLGRPMNDCGDGTPLATILRRSELNERWIVAHLNELAPDDFQLLGRARKFHIAHCPRSHAYFNHSPFPLQRLRGLEFNICLGTDSLASNESLSLFAEMRQLRKIEPSLSPRELVEMVTINPAAALKQSDTLGRIRSGFDADLIALPSPRGNGDTLEHVLAFDTRVPWTMIAGHAEATAA